MMASLTAKTASDLLEWSIVIVTSQVTVGGTAVPLATVPPGPCSVTVTNPSPSVLYVGAGTSVTSSTGVPVPAGAAVPVPGFPASSSVRLWAVTLGGATAPVLTAGVFLSTGD